MDYLLSGNSGTDNLSLQDMIECDIKTEFSDMPGMNCVTPTSFESLSCLTNDPDSFTHDLLHHRGLTMSPVTFVSSDAVSGHSDIKSNTWSSMQSVNLSTDILNADNSISDVLTMVNPMTGLPNSNNNSFQLQAVEPPATTGASSPSESSTVISPQVTRAPVQFVTTLQGATLQEALQSLQRQQQVTLSGHTLSLHSPVQPAPISQAVSSAASQATVTYAQPMAQESHSYVAQKLLTSNNNHLLKNRVEPVKVFPKPVYSYSCLIAMSLKNSETGALPVSDIYNFMTENFPYFKTAPDGWKNSVRHNLSLNKCFEKIENPKATGNTRKGCLWGLNPNKISKMDEEIAKWRKKDLEAIHRSMSNPDLLETFEKGNLANHPPRHSSHSSPKRPPITPAITTHQVNQSQPTINTSNVISMATSGAAATARSIMGDLQLSMIEIKPAENGLLQTPMKIKVEPVFIKSEPMDASGAVGGSTISEDFNILDALDPTLSDLALQNWEEFGAEGINLDDLPLVSLGQSLNTVSSSPLTIQSSKTGFSSAATSPLVSLLTSSVPINANGASGSASKLSIGHRIFAQT